MIRPSLRSLLPLCALAAIATPAGPVTTVPWNGHTGAVSFTYDDARDGQLPNLLPQLDSLHIKATFEIAAANVGTFNAHRSQWIQVAKNGHELANHTYNHENVNGSDGVAVTNIVKAMADTLRGLDPSIQSVTFAYPNCNLTANTTAKNGVSAENFIARGCAQTTYAWATQPSDWMNIQGLIVTSNPNNVSTATGLMTTAKNGNSWAVTIIHDVINPPPDIYSITPANNLLVLNAGISNNLWIDTYLTVGSYYRAHFTLDTTHAVVFGNGWQINWKSPHLKMPAKVTLRVKLDKAVFGDSIVVSQNDTAIARQSDSTYLVDFMKLQLTVMPKSATGISRSAWFRSARIDAGLSGRILTLRGVPSGTYALSVRSVSGALAEQKTVRLFGSLRGEPIALQAALRPGIYQVTLRDAATGTSRTCRLLTY